MKITVLGDVMCEPSVLNSSRQKDGTYNFDGLFAKVKPMLDEADYAIANLEFPMAGEENGGYTNSYYVFNAPDAFADATKKAGIDLVSIINNHTLDRGVDGMIRTIKMLEEKGLPATGAFLPDRAREEAYYFQVDGVRFALIAYTYTTNKKVPAGDKHIACMNLLRDLNMSTYYPEVWKKVNGTWVDKVFPKMKEENRCLIKKWVGLQAAVPRADDYMDMDMIKPYMDQFVSDIKKAKEKADFVICYPHVGGQFNPQPGKFSEYVVEEAIKAGADAVFASHSHMVQKACYQGDVPCAYSLGNFSMSPNTVFIVKEYLPDYGLAMHLYLEDKKLEKVTFSILKGVEKKGSQLVSWPVDELYKNLKTEKEKEQLIKDVRQVYGYVTGKEPEGEVIRKEYLLKK